MNKWWLGLPCVVPCLLPCSPFIGILFLISICFHKIVVSPKSKRFEKHISQLNLLLHESRPSDQDLLQNVLEVTPTQVSSQLFETADASPNQEEETEKKQEWEQFIDEQETEVELYKTQQEHDKNEQLQHATNETTNTTETDSLPTNTIEKANSVEETIKTNSDFKDLPIETNSSTPDESSVVQNSTEDTLPEAKEEEQENHVNSSSSTSNKKKKKNKKHR